MHACRVHIHDDKRSIFGDLYVSSEAWRGLCGSRASHASQVRWDPLENGWDSYVLAPLIGQYSVSVTLLTNQLFVWVYLNSGPDLTKRVPSFDREREDLSIDVKHDSVRWNDKKLRTIKNVVSYAVLHHRSIILAKKMEKFSGRFWEIPGNVLKLELLKMLINHKNTSVFFQAVSGMSYWSFSYRWTQCQWEKNSY